MKAVVLVGGLGTRLRPLTRTIPKQMLPVGGHKRLLDHVLEHLGGHGVSEAVLSMGYIHDAFTEAYPDRQCAGVSLRFVIEPEPLDTAGAVRFAVDEVGIDDTFVVVNGDVICDLDVTAVRERHHSTGAEATIALTRVDDPSAYGVVPTDDSGRVLGFLEKPAATGDDTSWVNAGTYVLEPAAAARIPAGRKASIERETFPAIAAAGALWALRSDAYWIDVGTPAGYLQAQLDLIDGLRGSAIRGVAGDADVDSEASVERSVVMGGAEVSAGAVVSGSAILQGATIGEGAQVSDSIVGPGADVGRLASVTGLSVLGEAAAVGDGQSVDGARIEGPRNSGAKR